ncbi:MAG: hypothetical protein U0401_00515 [Anaerolineae bacterium]
MNKTLATLIKEIGQERARQEAEVIRSHLAEIEQNLLNEAKVVATAPKLVAAMSNYDDIGIRTSLLVGAAPFAFDEIDAVDAKGKSFC